MTVRWSEMNYSSAYATKAADLIAALAQLRLKGDSMFTKLTKSVDPAPVLSFDPERQAVELAFLERLSRFIVLSNDRDRFVELATAGKIQEIFPDLDDTFVAPTPIPFASLEPFNYERWATEEWDLSEGHCPTHGKSGKMP